MASQDLGVDFVQVQAALTRWLSDDSRQGFFATDRQLRVIVWNRWMEIHSGKSSAQVLGRSILELYETLVSRGVDQCYTSALAGQVTVISHGLHHYLLPLLPTNPDIPHGEMPQSGHIGPLTNGAEVIGTVTILEDVSDRLATEGQLRKQIAALQVAQGMAESALRAKNEFLSTLSHEIRTPLNAVLGWARILLAREEIDPELLDRGLRVIERNAAAQAMMIDDMLDMARIVAGKLRVEMQPVDLASVVLAAVDVVSPAAVAKHVAIRTTLDPATPQVHGDPDRLQQVVWNLLSNALKFTEAGGHIEVRLEVKGHSAEVIVSDSGQGITEDFLPYVFERFRQNDTSSARRQGGLGLGLALVRELVQLHGGTVKAASAGPNQGSTFTIALPATNAPEVRTIGAGPRQHVEDTLASLADVHVLVVDDESAARELTVRVLEHRGARVTAVSSCAAAITGLQTAPPEELPHVIVSDIGMPNADGYDLIRQVRSWRAEAGGQIPAVTLSGYATPDDVERALAAGYQIHLAKPASPAALVTAVAKLARI